MIIKVDAIVIACDKCGREWTTCRTSDLQREAAEAKDYDWEFASNPQTVGSGVICPQCRRVESKRLWDSTPTSASLPDASWY